MGTFALDLQRFADKAKQKADDLVGAVVIRVASELDRRSPVGDASYWKSRPPKGYVGGRLRGNWQLGIDARPAGETGRVDTSGSTTQAAIIAEVPAQAAGKVYYLMNNVPYANEIERGHSRQAPQGLVALTAMQWQSFVNSAVAELPA